MGRTDKEIYRVIDNVNSYYRINSESKKELLLNKYPNAAAAYSLRLLDGYYRGPLVRVRRDSDDGVEVDVYPDYNNELSLDSLVSNVAVHTTNDGIEDTDATFLKSLQSLGEFVSNPNYVDGGTAVDATVCVWYDQSSTDGVPNDNDASQSVALNQPLIVSGGVIVTENGKPAIENVVAGQQGLIMGSFNINLSTFTCLLVSKFYADSSISGRAISIHDDLSTAYDYRYKNFGIAKDKFFLGTSAVSASSNALDYSSNNNQQLHIITGTEAFVDGSSVGVFSTSGEDLDLTPAHRFVISGDVGRDRDTHANTSEIIIYNSDQSSNRTGIEEDINSFYQIDGYTPTPKLIDLTQDLAVENGGTIADGTPAAAYSLRLLSSTYNGPLVRIRRTIDNTEVDVYPDSDGEFSIYSTIEDGGTELTTGVTGGSTDKTTLHEFLYGQDTDCMVVRWYDQASGNHATQDVATNQPKIYDSSTGVVLENGKPAVDFNSTSHVLPLQVHGHSAATIFETLQTSDTLLINYSGQAGPYYSWVAHSGDTNTTVYNNFGTPSMFVDGSAVSISNRGDVHTATATGSQILRTTTNANTSAWTLSKYSGFGSYEFIGTLQEFIVYNSNQSSNRTNIESNINQHYNIY